MRKLGFGIIGKKNVPMAAPHLNIKSLSQVATTVRALGQQVVFFVPSATPCGPKTRLDGEAEEGETNREIKASFMTSVLEAKRGSKQRDYKKMY
jgi:hypothetical protein